MLDHTFVKRKIKMILEDVSHLEELKDFSLNELAKDFYKLNAAERLLEKIIIRATDINNHIIAEAGEGIEKVRGYQDSFLRLVNFAVYPQAIAGKLAEDAKFRNVLVHEYNNVDEVMTHKKIKEVIDDFRQYAQCIITFLEKQQENIRT